MSVPAEGISLTGFAQVLAIVLGIYLILGQPVVGAWNTRRFARDLVAEAATPASRHGWASVAASPASRHAARPTTARLGRYHRTLTLEWTLVALALLVVATGRVGFGPVGVQLPAVDRGALPYTVAGSVCLLLSALGLVSLRRRVLTADVPVRGPARVVELMPRDRLERRTFAAVAVTAGICEEFLYRGFGVLLAAVAIPGIEPWRALLICAVGFGLAHAYQGPAGMIATLVVGGCLAVLYLGTRSLLLPVLFHILIDLRVLLLPAPAEPVERAVAEHV